MKKILHLSLGILTSLMLCISCTKEDTNTQENTTISPSSEKTINWIEIQTNEDEPTSPLNAADVEMVFVEGGTYMMGTGNDAHTVTVSSFYISKYEITYQQLVDFLNGYGSLTIKEGQYKGEKLTTLQPIDGVYVVNEIWRNRPYSNKWMTVNEYTHWAGGRLPTEAEWEYAARGGNKSNGYTYSGSNNIKDVGWYSGNSGGNSHEGGLKQPNELGIYDMTGNVYEWCSDWYSATYYAESAGSIDPQGPTSGTKKVYRGGGNGCPAAKATVYWRDGHTVSTLQSDLGFRLVRSVEQQVLYTPPVTTGIYTPRF